MVDNEILKLIGFLDSEFLWLYFIIIIVAFYAVIGLLTWSIKKPLMFLGIPSIIVGALLIILRFSISMFLSNESLLMIFDSMVKPLFTIGLICVLVGIVMIALYIVLREIQKKKQAEEKVEI